MEQESSQRSPPPGSLPGVLLATPDTAHPGLAPPFPTATSRKDAPRCLTGQRGQNQLVLRGPDTWLTIQHLDSFLSLGKRFWFCTCFLETRLRLTAPSDVPPAWKRGQPRLRGWTNSEGMTATQKAGLRGGRRAGRSGPHRAGSATLPTGDRGLRMGARGGEERARLGSGSPRRCSPVLSAPQARTPLPCWA